MSRSPAKTRALLLLTVLAGSAHAVTSYTGGDFGGVGLLQMPTARMNEAGELGFNVTRVLPYSRYNFTAQPFDWLEGTFRYTSISNRRYAASTTGQSNKDKSFDVKLRFLRESHWLPEAAFGIRDMGGTGYFCGEYLVASKRAGDLDFSLGLGFGYVGARGNLGNPLGVVADRFDTRPPPKVGKGGKLGLDTWLRGPAALFGGVEYQTPWSPLRLKLEYDGNNYRHEPQANNQRQSSPLNVGMVLRASRYLDVTAGLERGNTALVGITLHGQVGQAKPESKVLDPLPEKAAPKDATAGDWPAVAARLRTNAGIDVDEIRQEGDTLVVTGEQQRFYYPAQGMGRAARILDHAADETVNNFALIDTHENLPLVETRFTRQSFNEALRHDLTQTQFRQQLERRSPAANASGELLYRSPLTRYNGGFGLYLQNSMGGPDAFMLYRLNATYDAEFRLTRHAWLSGAAMLGLVDNYDRFTYTAPSNLPRVRTYSREYMTASRLNLSSLQANLAERLTDDWYGLLYGGVLESMYDGAGGELLYRPLDRRWALGANANWVRQRGFRQDFSLRDYEVATGHVTAYLREFDDKVLFKVSAGRYLAGDWGGTLDVSRRFRNGVTMGVWATRTNVSATEFGEGSFDKGFYVTIPFDLMLPRSTTSVANLVWHPLLRDGGAMLHRRYELYEMTSLRDAKLFDDNLSALSR